MCVSDAEPIPPTGRHSTLVAEMSRHTTTAEAPTLLTISEVASALRISYETARRRVADGTVRSIALGCVIRVPASELERIIDDVSATRRET